MAKKKTVKPTGLDISRVGNKFTFVWKIGDKDYNDGQTFQYKVGNGKWTAKKIGKKDTSVVMDLATPVGTTGVTFHVRGNRASYVEGTKKKKGLTSKIINPSVSDWAEKIYTIEAPKAPTLTKNLSNTQWNKCTYSWSVADTENTKPTWFTGIEWQSILVKDSNVANGAQLDAQFKSGTLGWANGSSAQPSGTWDAPAENTSVVGSGNYTRWFRCRSVGIAGTRGWQYIKNVFASPKQAVVQSVKGVATNAGGTNVEVSWTADATYSQPIDNTTVQYLNITPIADLKCPPGASGWHDISVSADTSGKDLSIVSVDDAPGIDECMFVRVNNSHDSRVTQGVATLAKVGKLATPTGLNVSTNDSTHRASITATNASAVPDSFLAVYYQSTNTPMFCIGIIPHGQSQITVQCPNWGNENIKFFVKAVVGSYRQTTRADGVSNYALVEKMVSDIQGSGGAVPEAPSNVTASMTDIPGNVMVTWNWDWDAANAAELSWADHEDAWESTDEPSTFLVDNTHSSYWTIAGLETGKVWYIRVRLVKIEGDTNTYSRYSQIAPINLASAPTIPFLELDKYISTTDGTVTARWGYSTSDGTPQSNAVLAEVVTSGGSTRYVEVAHTETAQHVLLNVADLGWATGTRHGLAVRVASGSGQQSDDWSSVVYVDIAEPVTAAITNTSLVNKTITIDGFSRTALSLTTMPLSVMVTGAGTNGTVILNIERAGSYHIYRPDESELDGYDRETIYAHQQVGSASITIDNDDLIGRLDDGASYRIVATVKDSLGQSATASLEFEVHWVHQALIPNGTVIIDNNALAAVLKPIAPSTGLMAGDVCDIYRLSVDKPVLVYQGAEFGEKYVDPYPAIGEFGGYRFVFRTKNGDYITEDGMLAWTDIYETIEDDDYNIIDFDGGQIILTRNIDLSSSWEKDFQETRYLGGSIQGDWNPAVSRSASIGAKALTLTDQDTIEAMRRLAVHPGICHVRTKDGSSYTADVQVTENYPQKNRGMVAEFSLKITRVDPEELDGLSYADWLESQARGQLS